MMNKYLQKIIIVFGLSLLFSGVLVAQCVENTVFDAGEKLEFSGFYNWGFLWVKAGKVRVDIDTTEVAGKTAYQIKGAARNAKAFEMFFKLRDTLTTVLDAETLLPHSLDRITNEGNYHRRHQYFYNYSQKKIQTYVHKNGGEQKNFQIEFDGCVHNLMSVLYYARNIDYDNLKEGDKVPFKMLVDGKISDVEILYRGVGKLKTKHGRRFWCYKITPVLPGGAMFEKGDGMIVWLTKDKNRVPIQLEAEIRVGSVKGILERYSGLRHKDNVFGNTAAAF